MITLHRFEQIVRDLSGELPDVFFHDLDGGIRVTKIDKIHPATIEDNLYILGEYQVRYPIGRSIIIYYGSFEKMYHHLDEYHLIKEIRHVLRHEFRHHLEHLAGQKDLEIVDKQRIDKYIRSQEAKGR